MRQQIQQFGRTLSGMVMPNIGAFIAWGFITALFIPEGWWPNGQLAQLVGPMLTYLLPLLIAYTAGRKRRRGSGAGNRAIAARRRDRRQRYSDVHRRDDHGSGWRDMRSAGSTAWSRGA